MATCDWTAGMHLPGNLPDAEGSMSAEVEPMKSRSADDSLCLGQLSRLSVLECLHSDTKGCLDNSTGENQSGI